MKSLLHTPLRGTGLALAHATVGWLLAGLALFFAGEGTWVAPVVFLAVFLPLSSVYFRWPTALPRTPAAITFSGVVVRIDVFLAFATGDAIDLARMGGWMSPALVFVATWVMGSVEPGSRRWRTS